MDQRNSPDDEADPDGGFASVVALRRMADDLERRTVVTALKQGWSWSDIAQALGVSKQAAHKRLSGAVSKSDT